MQPITTTAGGILLALTLAAATAGCSFEFSTGDDTATSPSTIATSTDAGDSAGNSGDSTTTSTTAETTSSSDATTSSTEATTQGSVLGSFDAAVVKETAERFISTTIAEQFGEPLEPTCADVPAVDPPVTFACTATTADGRVLKLDGSVDETNNLNVVTTNVVLAQFLPELARVAAEVLAEGGAEGLTIDCGTVSIVLDDAQEMVCDSVDAGGASGSVTYTIDDTRTGDFRVRIN